MRHFNRVRDTVADNLPHIEEIGQPQFRNNYPFGWAMAGNTPLKRYKQNTHGGGVRDPLIISWPRRIAGGGLRHQFHHVTDIVPTVLEALAVDSPAEVNGIAQQPIEGTSLVYSWEAPDSPTQKQVQYFEMLGHRGIWRDGWKAVTWHRSGTPFEDDRWELYHVAEDISECHDLAAEHPERLRELVETWWAEAGKYRVLPLDDRTNRWSSANPYNLAARDDWVLYPGSTRLPGEVTPDIRNRSYEISAHVDIPATGAEGVLIALGDSVGGYALYIKDGRLVHDYNYLGKHFVVTSERPVPVGPCILGYAQRRTGERSAAGTLTINGEASGSIDIPETYAARVSAVGMEIGRAPAPAVGEFEAPFAFTGAIDRVEFDLLPDQDADEEAATEAALSEQ
jgi:arylsulfatase